MYELVPRRAHVPAMLIHDSHPSAPAGPAGAGARVAAVVLDAEALDRLRELDPKGDNHLLERVLAAFKTSVGRLVPQLHEASAAGDLAGVRHVAHTLKSSSASIGATRLAQICTELETLIRLDQVDTLEARVDAMSTEIDGVLTALNLLLDEKR